MKQIQISLKTLVLTTLTILLVFTNAFSQTKSIVGTIKDNHGEPLPGVTVVVQGTNTGVVTDFEGNFTISALPADKLVITFIGLKQQVVSIGDKTKLSVIMEPDVISLDEVIAVGYSSKKKTEISSSVVYLNSEQLSAATATAIDGIDLLQGKVAGLTIMDNNYDSGQSPSVRIRGTGSINASSEPLWVIDGVIASSTAFNPNDVESMTIMKDAGATGLYGSKASGGVIVVTTKSGKAGVNRFNVNVSYGINKPWWGNFKGLMNSEQLYDFYHEAFMNDNDYLKVPNSEALWKSSVVKGKTRDEVIATDFDWLDAMYPKGATQKYAISHTGGNEKTTHYISFSYNKSDGTLRGNFDEQFSGTLNLSHKVSEKLQFDAKVFTSRRTINFPVVSENVRYAPFDNPYNEDGSLKELDEVLTDWIGTKASNILVNEYIGNTNNQLDLSFVPTLSVSYQISPSLKFTSTTKYSFNSNLDKDYVDGRSYVDEQNPNMGLLGETNAYVSRRHAKRENLLNNELLTFNRQFGNHSLNVLIGIELQQNKSDGFMARNTGLVNGIDVLSATTGIPVVSGSPDEVARQSYLSQANYDFLKKYFLTASYRSDGSSKFGSNNRFGNFYSASASWVVTNETFMKSADHVISNLKLRASYGVTGNDNFPNYTAVETYSLSGADYNYQSGAAPTQFANPDLTWEKAYTSNLGVDLGLWKKLDVTLDYYQIYNSDILYNVPIDPTTGFESAWQNIGDVRNRGLEFSFSGNILKTKSFKWNTNLSLAYNHNEVVSLTNEAETGIINSNLGTILKVGEDISSSYEVDYIGADPETGLATWNTVDENGIVNGTTHWATDPKIAYKTRNMSPRFTGGLNNKFSFKGFTLDIMMTYVGGFYTNLKNMMWFRFGEKVIQGQSSAILDNRWKQPGDNAYFPRIFYGVYGKTAVLPNKPTGINVVKGDYLKINYISLGYDVPAKIAKKLSLADLNIFCRFNNPYLFVFDDHFTFSTPESTGYGSTENVNNKLRPVIQNLIFGVNIGF